MANSSLCFNTDNDDAQLSPFEGDEEEEYDALNDETFGAFEDTSTLDDWEQQHEQFAELAESSKQSDNLENCITKLDLKEKSRSDYDYNHFVDFCLSEEGRELMVNTIKECSTLFDQNYEKNPSKSSPSRFSSPNPSLPTPIGKPSNKFCTVEELERGLLNQNKQENRGNRPPSIPHPPQLHPAQHHPSFQQPHPLPTRFPPGLPPPQVRHLHGPPNMPPGLIHILPNQHYMHGNHTTPPPPPPPGLVFPPHQLPPNHPYNFPPPPRVGHMPNMPYQNRVNHIYPQQQQHPQQLYPQQQQQLRKMEVNNVRHRNEYFDTPRDEYAGLMSNREKQWLINIQLVQLNTGTPYFDDYYYTIYKERKLRNSKENQPPVDRRHRRNSERQENQTLTPKTYTPLQFENSLGKLQCGSVTAPRKMIDMDIVTQDKEGDVSSSTSRDTKKTKQLLLELEAFYSLMLKAEDLKNPLYSTNLEKLCEIKQKQRLRELDLATTSEQKQEILQSLREDCQPISENPQEYLTKVVNGLFQDDKFVNFLSIRKGKMLLLRVFPYLTGDTFTTQLPDIWIKIFATLPLIGRKDVAGDNLLVRLHPHFKRFIQTSDVNVILDIVSSLLEVLNRDSSRNTPISHQSKQLLNFVVVNKFGISALVTIFVRIEYLMSLEKLNDKQQLDWSNFLTRWAESLMVPKLVLVSPLEPVALSIFNKHCDRFDNLPSNKTMLLEKCIVDGN